MLSPEDVLLNRNSHCQAWNIYEPFPGQGDLRGTPNIM